MARKNSSYRKVLFLCLLFIAIIAMAKTEKRVALIWGNAEYDGWDNLPQCTHDADTIADRLWKLGFDTLMLKNGNKSEMESSLYRFQERIKGAEVAVFFYSGHAFNDGSYYLVPSKTELDQGNRFPPHYFSANEIFRIMRKHSDLSLLFFDACRVGEGDLEDGDGIMKGATRTPRNIGHEENQLRKPEGYGIYYATKNDDVARTGDGDLSIFSRVLADHIADNEEFHYVFSTVKRSVYERTNGKQRPQDVCFYQNGLYFNPAMMHEGNVVDNAQETRNKHITNKSTADDETEEITKKSDVIPAPIPMISQTKVDGIDRFGIDINKNTGYIEWKDLQDNNKNLEFVYIRATEGSYYVDPFYKTAIRDARKNGIKVGSYHYLSTRSPITTQFQNFVNTVKIEDQDLIPVIDCESIKPWTSQQLRDSLRVFVNLVEEYYGVKPMIYTSDQFFTLHLGRAFYDCSLWIAKYTKDVPNIGTEWTLWQFTDNASISGISGSSVDASVYNKNKTINDLLIKKKKKE